MLFIEKLEQMSTKYIKEKSENILGKIKQNIPMH